MSAYNCPFCGVSIALSNDTYSNYFLNFYDVTKFKNNAATWKRDNITSVKVVFIKCPNCKKISIYTFGHSSDLECLKINVNPRINCNYYPNYVPEKIRNDYKEACAILEFSPRSAAALARKCLRDIIQDYWQITRTNLYEELCSLQEVDIDPDLWKAIAGICNLGNIGKNAKEESMKIIDVDEAEAQRLIRLVELLIKEWYIARNNRDLFYEQILNLSNDSEE